MTKMQAIKQADGPIMAALEYVPEPLVSVDFNHNTYSSNFASRQSPVIGGTLVPVLVWYENEWGFSCRIADNAVAMGAYL